jgi:hypothetical protein
MHTPTYDTTPELEDLLKKLDEQDSIHNQTHFLVDEVRFSDLRKMNDANLAGRLAYYEREYTFELNKKKRAEFYREVIRTKIELRRRVLVKREEAIKAALPENVPGDVELASAA